MADSLKQKLSNLRCNSLTLQQHSWQQYALSKRCVFCCLTLQWEEMLNSSSLVIYLAVIHSIEFEFMHCFKKCIFPQKDRIPLHCFEKKDILHRDLSFMKVMNGCRGEVVRWIHWTTNSSSIAYSLKTELKLFVSGQLLYTKTILIYLCITF